MERSEFPFPGFGAGLRRPHHNHAIENPPRVDWLEVISDNFIVPGGRPVEVLDAVR